MALPPAPNAPGFASPSAPSDPMRDTPEVERFRNLTKLALLVQTIAVIIAAIATVPAMGARGSPTYIPLVYFLFILVLGGVVLSAEGFIFRHMEISRMNSDSRRYLLAHFSFKDGLTMGLIGVIVGGILVVPAVAQALEGYSEQENTWHHAASSPVTSLCVRFLSDDWLGLSRVSAIYVEPSNGSVEVFVFFVDPSDDSPDCPKPEDTAPVHQRSGVNAATKADPERWSDIRFPGLRMVKVLLKTDLANDVRVHYGFEVTIYFLVLPVIGVLVLIYGAINLALAASMQPVKNRYKGAAALVGRP